MYKFSLNYVTCIWLCKQMALA